MSDSVQLLARLQDRGLETRDQIKHVGQIKGPSEYHDSNWLKNDDSISGYSALNVSPSQTRTVSVKLKSLPQNDR